MTDCNCVCSTFGPGPHDADRRHPNPKACEHAEDTLRATVENILSNPSRYHDAGRIHARLQDALDSIVDPSL